MIKSFSNVPSFRKQIIALSTNSTGYLWRRRSDTAYALYCDGVVIAQEDSIEKLYVRIKDHAKRVGAWFEPSLEQHYYTHINGVWRVYVNGKYCKKSKEKDKLEIYVEVLSWLKQTRRGPSWGHK
jgi:hypothetical protein